jgi:DNA-binding Lrp family transcriptional regulator
MIDTIDKQILFELDVNARQSIKKIAKRTKHKRDTVAYRIKQLEKKGIIQRYISIIDYARLGYRLCRLYLRFQNTTPEKEKEIISFLTLRKEIFTVYSTEGNWDVALGFLVTSLQEFNKVIKDIQSKYQEYIHTYQSAVFLEYVHYYRTYLTDPKYCPATLIITGKETKKEKTDEKDHHILRILAENGKCELIDMAKQLKITSMAVKYRIKQLEKKRIILGYRALIDHTKLNYHYYKIDFDIEDMSKLQQLQAFAQQHPNIVFEDRTIGGSDFEIDVELEGHDALYKLIEEIKESFPRVIRNYTYYKARKIYKYVYFPEK